jgi:transposase
MKIDTIAPEYAAIDLGATDLYVAIADTPVRRFGTFTRDLHALAAWLREHHIQHVAMEATGVYWINPHDVLEAAGFNVTLFDGAGARNLPGRKSDIQDPQWHAMLHSYGLLPRCFVPTETIRHLRSYVRQRDDLLELAAMSVQHMQRALDLMNIRLHHVISQLHGVSGLRIIEAILAGERNPVALARLCAGQIRKNKEAEVIASLEGHWQEHHLFVLRQAHARYGFFQQQLTACDQQIGTLLTHLTVSLPPQTAAPGTKIKTTRHNPVQVPNLYERLLTLSGGRDAQQLPAIGPLSWLKIIAEVGTDLTRWPTPEHFTGYAGLNPRCHRSGQRSRRVPRRKTRLGQIFREAVMSLQNTKDCAVGEFYRRIKGRRGAPIANVAAARKLAELYWRVMTHGLAYVEQGLAAYRQRQQQQTERYLRRTAAKLGFALQPISSPNSDN